ncbi:pyruvate dehydrogenase complex dihydrolipoamide acetyltransferase [Anaerolineales bacterium]
MAKDVVITMDGLLLNWLKNAGDAVSAGELLAEVEADKATFEVEAPADGVLLETRAEIGDKLSEGDVIAIIGAAGEATADTQKDEPAPAAAPTAEASQSDKTPEKASAPASEPAVSNQSESDDGRIKVSPLARRIAEEKGIALNQISGTGPGGRIVKSDVENYKPGAAPAPAAASSATAGSVSGPLSGQTWGTVPTDDVEIIEISRMRRAIADNTVISKQWIPHFYITMVIDVEPMLNLRKKINASLEDEGIKVSVNDMLVKAVALTLLKFPNLNTHYYGDKLVRHKRINIGIAVSIPDGLLNVVAKDADKVALSNLATTNREMFDRARSGKIKPDDIRGSTFTISNLGPYDVEEFGAIINPPEAGILAVSAAQRVPVINEDGTVGVGSRMKVTLSADHRVSDGAEGAEFVKALKELLENPMRLLV